MEKFMIFKLKKYKIEWLYSDFRHDNFFWKSVESLMSKILQSRKSKLLKQTEYIINYTHIDLISV